MDIATKLVDSKSKKRDNGYLAFGSLISIGLIAFVGKYKETSLIEIYKLRWIFKDTETFRSYAGILMAFSFVIFFVLVKRALTFSIGFFKVSEIRINCNRVVFSIGEMNYLKFSINSPGVFGIRNFRQGSMNWVEFLINGQVKKFEFYIENQTMEDSIISLIGELKTIYKIPISVDIKAGKGKESWFESWFGNG